MIVTLVTIASLLRCIASHLHALFGALGQADCQHHAHRHLEVAYVIVQVLCLAMFYMLYTKVTTMKEGGEMIKV
eukprot:3695207-Amphidinium_carterae.1